MANTSAELDAVLRELGRVSQRHARQKATLAEVEAERDRLIRESLELGARQAQVIARTDLSPARVKQIKAAGTSQHLMT